jgi:DNA-binding transcriptional MerR regulator
MSLYLDPQLSPPSPRGVDIAQVAHVLGVPMPTLRSWELRYGIPDTPRTSGRHRRYFPPQLHALRLMRDEIARGQRAGLAAQNVHHMLTAQGTSAQAIVAILTQVEQLDGPGLETSFDTAAAVLGVGGGIDEVLLPAIRQVGDWSDASCVSGQEQAMTAAVRGWLGRRTVYAPPPRPGPPVLLACGPGDEHTIGIEALALLLRLAGWPCRILGARIATSDLLAAAAAHSAAGVVVVCQLASGRRQAVSSILAIHRHGTPVFYAGNAFAVPRACRGVPGLYLGSNLQDACALTDHALAAGSPRLMTAPTPAAPLSADAT